jgi:hypothetical protein
MDVRRREITPRGDGDRSARAGNGGTGRGSMTRTMQRTTRRRRTNRLEQWLGLRDSDRIRPSRVLAARARIASGHYDRPEVRDFLLEALLQALRRH